MTHEKFLKLAEGVLDATVSAKFDVSPGDYEDLIKHIAAALQKSEDEGYEIGLSSAPEIAQAKLDEAKWNTGLDYFYERGKRDVMIQLQGLIRAKGLDPTLFLEIFGSLIDDV